MFALQPVEGDPGRFDAPHRSRDVAQLRRVEVDRVIRRRAKIGDRPGARVPDRRRKDWGRRRIAVLRCARFDDRHCPGLPLFRRKSVRPKPLPFNPVTIVLVFATAKSAQELSGGSQMPLATSSRVGRLATIGGLVSRPSPRRPEMSGKRR
jgi:hypothetical protein